MSAMCNDNRSAQVGRGTRGGTLPTSTRSNRGASPLDIHAASMPRHNTGSSGKRQRASWRPIAATSHQTVLRATPKTAKNLESGLWGNV